ncbi:unnamed protein product [Arabis nemorensis]|uniref:Acidic protein n=1 Tax=Arabis nemorensis TaxID=586526 RepID=A0A565B7U0_9BRAS|nr:unnamed protein product [Arabis nemorensis]
MEGKTVILSVLIMSLVMAQIQVEAKSCCPSTTGRNIYNTCRFGGGSRSTCASLSGYKIVDGTCPEGYTKDILENSDASEIVNGAVEQCTKACSTFCAKGSKIAVKTA